MQIRRVNIANLRGVSEATILLPRHAVLIGDNNAGKTTILEAIDLALGPDRLNRRPPVDEHDFYGGQYRKKKIEFKKGDLEAVLLPDPSTEQPGPAVEIEDDAADAPRIEVEVTVIDLNEEQQASFGEHIEFWNIQTNSLHEGADPAAIDSPNITTALRVTFRGWYDEEEDDFEGRTYFTRSLTEDDSPSVFSKRDKQICGFLYLRSLRTGSRALSLERGSLLDIILRLKETRPQMWEDTIEALAAQPVATDPKLGISSILQSINTALKKYVPKEWGIEPHLKVSNLTREHLRKVITAFIATGSGTHAAPFYRQGTGTINMLVLAMLSQIAEDKQNVIFAMEEPETAIPPYAQKRIIHEIRRMASQAVFTSHSPYVLEEFALDETVVLNRDTVGKLTQSTISLPASIKPKRYRQEFRTRFSEGLLTRRVLLAEGATEAASLPAVCRRLNELDPSRYSSLEALGICTVDAGGETNILDLAKLYRSIGKQTLALCDKQTPAQETLLKSNVDLLLMHDEKGFENLVLRNTTGAALKRFALLVDWPPHLILKHPNLSTDPLPALTDYFLASKGNWSVADFLGQCTEAEVPLWLRDSCVALKAAFST